MLSRYVYSDDGQVVEHYYVNVMYFYAVTIEILCEALPQWLRSKTNEQENITLKKIQSKLKEQKQMSGKKKQDSKNNKSKKLQKQ